MSEVQVSPVPVVLVYGRFKLSRAPDGALVAAATTGTCDRCRMCGCGDKQPYYHIPPLVLAFFGKRLKGLLGDGTNDDSPDAA
jgi:hypothetical protein